MESVFYIVPSYKCDGDLVYTWLCLGVTPSSVLDNPGRVWGPCGSKIDLGSTTCKKMISISALVLLFYMP